MTNLEKELPICRIRELEPELQAAKQQLVIEIRDARSKLEEAERVNHAFTTKAQESQERLQTDLEKMNKRLAARDAKIDDWAEQLVGLYEIAHGNASLLYAESLSPVGMHH